MDLAKLSALCRTLTVAWQGCFIGKSWIDTQGRLLIRMRLPGKSAYLLLCTDKKKFGFGLVEARPPCPKRPPQLAAYLRAHVEGGRLVSAMADPARLLVEFTFARRDKRFTLVLDGQTRHRGQTRMFIADDDGILRCATRWDADDGSPLRPGAQYSPLAVEEEVNSDVGPDSDEELLFETGAELVEGLELIEAAKDEKNSAKHEKRWRKKLERRIEKITAELEGASDLAGAKEIADALGGNLHLVKRGMERVTIEGGEEGGLVIELDPSLEPGENLNRLYDRVKKIKRTAIHAKRRLKQTREELAEGPPKAPEVKKPGKREQPAQPFHRFSTSDGWTILVGRNRLENDRLVKESRPWDLWFHARDGAGAHVVLVKPGRDSKPTQLSLNEAAGVAAYHSKLSGETKAEVMYTEISRVRKPKGAGPGRVVVADDRTLIVRPSLPKNAK